MAQRSMAKKVEARALIFKRMVPGSMVSPSLTAYSTVASGSTNLIVSSDKRRPHTMPSPLA